MLHIYHVALGADYSDYSVLKFLFEIVLLLLVD